MTEHELISTGEDSKPYRVASVWDVLDRPFTKYAIDCFLGKHHMDDDLMCYIRGIPEDENTDTLWHNLLVLIKDAQCCENPEDLREMLPWGHSLIIAACEAYTITVRGEPSSVSSIPPAVFTDHSIVKEHLGNPYEGRGYDFVLKWVELVR